MTPDDSTPRIARLRAEYGAGTVVGTARPRLSWIVENAVDWTQRGYELRDADTTVAVESDASLFVPWPFADIRSREQRIVQVRAASDDGRRTDWSDRLVVEAGLLDPADWRAAFVGSAEAVPAAGTPSSYLRHGFDVAGPVAAARLYVTALGVFEPYLNGSALGDQVLAPNWTSYYNRLRYQIFDVTDRIQQGRNVVGAVLGDGWYRGPVSKGVYGDRLALLAQLELLFTDGTRQTVVTDESWRATTGPILAGCIYDGELYDARLELPGWAGADYDDSDWRAVAIVDHPQVSLVAPTDPPIRRIEEVPVVEVLASPSGTVICDFGQNLAGRLRIQVTGEAGDTVTIRHGEVLCDGDLYRENLGTARAEDTYILKGDGVETWEPRFTYRGFRYAEIDGWPGTFDPAQVTAVVLHTDFERTGWFECSDPLVDRLHENSVWTMRSNFLGLPTDNPQRGERRGWTGDAGLFAPSAAFLYDVNGLFASWLADLAADQGADGRMPHTVPSCVFIPPPPDDAEEWIRPAWLCSSAAWGDAAVIVPWVLYQRFGDIGLLTRQWDSMRKWVDYAERLAGPTRLWDSTFHFGDWLDPLAAPDRPHRGQTPPEVLATAYFARSAELVARTADVLGHDDDARNYKSLAEQVRMAFRTAFMDDAGNLAVPSATAQALLLAFCLAETDEQRRRAGARLSRIVTGSGYRMSTGLIGTAIICDALCEAGDLAAAYRLVLQTEYPSWLHMVKMGATTIWERWDGIHPDGRINPEPMNSLNQYALGTIVDWLHRTVAGLEPAEPGYRKIRFHPRPGGGLTHASARHRTPYGMAAISWHLDAGRLEIEVQVPANTEAEVLLPGPTTPPVCVRSGTHRWSVAFDHHITQDHSDAVGSVKQASR